MTDADNVRGGLKCPWCEHREFIKPFMDDHMTACPYRPRETTK